MASLSSGEFEGEREALLTFMANLPKRPCYARIHRVSIYNTRPMGDVTPIVVVPGHQKAPTVPHLEDIGQP